MMGDAQTPVVDKRDGNGGAPTLRFFEALSKRVEAVDSVLCVGLDPHGADLDRWVFICRI